MDCNVLGISREEFVSTVPDYHIYIFYANQETIVYDQETAAQLREKHKKSLILFAGPYATVVPEKILTSPAVDAVIRGELEIPLRELCDNKPLSSIQGLTWKDGEVVSNKSGLPKVGGFGLTCLGVPDHPPRLASTQLSYSLFKLSLHLASVRTGLSQSLHILSVASNHDRPPLSDQKHIRCCRRNDLDTQDTSHHPRDSD